jgi:hypothetical protein
LTRPRTGDYNLSVVEKVSVNPGEHYCKGDLIKVGELGFEAQMKWSKLKAIFNNCLNGCDAGCPIRRNLELIDEEDFDEDSS